LIKTVSVTEVFSFELLEQDDAEGEGTSAAAGTPLGSPDIAGL